jgi:hypothetical protein
MTGREILDAFYAGTITREEAEELARIYNAQKKAEASE